MSSNSVTKYLASIGAKGGKKSPRKLSKKDARQMALKRHAKSKAKIIENNCLTTVFA